MIKFLYQTYYIKEFNTRENDYVFWLLYYIIVLSFLTTYSTSCVLGLLPFPALGLHCLCLTSLSWKCQDDSLVSDQHWGPTLDSLVLLGPSLTLWQCYIALWSLDTIVMIPHCQLVVSFPFFLIKWSVILNFCCFLHTRFVFSYYWPECFILVGCLKSTIMWDIM
jgi:hypothetical protein